MLNTGKILRRETERTVMTALTRRVFELYSPKRYSDEYADARASKLLRLRRISRCPSSDNGMRRVKVSSYGAGVYMCGERERERAKERELSLTLTSLFQGHIGTN